MIVVTAVGRVAAGRILYLVAILVEAERVWRLAQLVVVPVVAAERHCARHVVTVLEVDIGTYLKPVSYLRVHLHTCAVCLVLVALDGTFLVEVAEAHVVVEVVCGA